MKFMLVSFGVKGTNPLWPGKKTGKPGTAPSSINRGKNSENIYQNYGDILCLTPQCGTLRRRKFFVEICQLKFHHHFSVATKLR